MRPLRFLLITSITAFLIFLFNEYLIYYLVLYQCTWPRKIDSPVRAMLIADTHLLGPIRGHWLDKLRREWQMHRSFQTAVNIFQPGIIFVLGDVFDEGDIVNQREFRRYVIRFERLFRPPSDTQMYSIIGNHDAGFHYRLHPILVDRFEKSFNKTSNTIITFRGIHFVMLNSMTMERDGCGFCEKAENDIRSIALKLKCTEHGNQTRCKYITPLESYSRPILLQHFPTYRPSDVDCIESDSPLNESYREGWEVISKSATDFLGKYIKPRVSFSGHSHHYCYLVNSLGIDEYTIASFNWRNKVNPSFLLAEFSPTSHAVHKCDLPNEFTVIALYALFILLILFSFITIICRCCRRKFKKI